MVLDLKFSNHQILTFLKVKLRKVWDENCQILTETIVNDTLPKIYREVTKDFPKLCEISVVMSLADSHKIGLRVIGHQFAEDFLTNLRKFSDKFVVAIGCTLKEDQPLRIV